MSKKEILILTGVVAAWRALLMMLGVIANNLVAFAPQFAYRGTNIIDSLRFQWLYSWANFDGVHYLTIIDKGYIGTGLIQAFFPVYPLLAKGLNFLINDSFLAAFIISQFFLWLMILVFYYFVKEVFSKKTAWWSIVALLTFPTSFYFGAVYTESFFLLLVLSSFLAAHKRQWWLAGILAAIASATRVVGIILVPALFIEFTLQNLGKTGTVSNLKDLFVLFDKKLLFQIWGSFSKASKTVYLWIAFGFTGLGSYMFYLNKYFHDPLYFFHVQAEFGGIREETIVLYPQVIWRYLKIFFFYREFGFAYYAFILEFLTATIAMLVLLYSIRKIKLPYVFFAVISLIIPTLTGTFSSLPRYILVSFPLFILIATYLEKNKIFGFIWLSVSTLLLIFTTILFVQGHWVA